VVCRRGRLSCYQIGKQARRISAPAHRDWPIGPLVTPYIRSTHKLEDVKGANAKPTGGIGPIAPHFSARASCSSSSSNVSRRRCGLPVAGRSAERYPRIVLPSETRVMIPVRSPLPFSSTKRIESRDDSTGAWLRSSDSLVGSLLVSFSRTSPSCLETVFGFDTG
jgi:hypothetical protein